MTYAEMLAVAMLAVATTGGGVAAGMSLASAFLVYSGFSLLCLGALGMLCFQAGAP